MSFLPLVRIWLWVSVLASAAGWLLSAFGQLNRAGYLVFAGVAVVVFAAGRKWLGWSEDLSVGLNYAAKRGVNWRKVRWRFKRFLPMSFLLLAALVFVGGIL